MEQTMNNTQKNAQCPWRVNANIEKTTFLTMVRECREQIEESMKSLGLSPVKMAPMVKNAAILMARNEMISIEAALTPLTYNEVSREGHKKPVTHPVHVQATTVANALAGALKQLGIYAATDKVATDPKDPNGGSSKGSGIASMFNDLGNEPTNK